MIYASFLEIGDFRDVLETVEPKDFINTTELKTYNEFLFIEDKMRMLAARILLKGILKRFYPISFDIKTLMKDKNGKPFLNGIRGLGITHSNEMVAVVIAKNNLVGIDVQKLGSVKMNDIYMNTCEKQNFLALAYQAQIKFLSDTWTMKESVVKADGMGLKGIEKVKIDWANKYASLDNKQWYFRKTPSLLDYSIALCSDDICYDVLWLNPKDLILNIL